MSYFSQERPDDITQSKFYIDITNELGLKYKKQRAHLMGVALAKPANYYALRAKLVEQLTTAQVEHAYKLYWNLLKNGVIGTESSAKQVQYYDEKDSICYLKCDLPEHLINKFSSRVAATMEEIAEEAVNLILPEDFLKLAQEKQKDILGARGQI
jgi:hypothetical protein